MDILIALFALMLVGGLLLAGMAVIWAVVKATFYVALLPLKLLFLPLLAVIVVVKLAVVLAFVSVLVAVLIPLAIIVGLLVAPFALIAALT